MAGARGGDPEIFERVLNAYRYIWAEVIREVGIKEAPPLPISVSGYAGGLGASMLFDAGDNGYYVYFQRLRGFPASTIC
jgi:hypothetical protein